MLLRNLLPTTFFFYWGWGAFLTRASGYLVFSYFQTPKPPIWMHIYKVRPAWLLLPGLAHWCLASLCWSQCLLCSPSRATGSIPKVYLVLGFSLSHSRWLYSPIYYSIVASLSLHRLSLGSLKSYCFLFKKNTWLHNFHTETPQSPFTTKLLNHESISFLLPNPRQHLSPFPFPSGMCLTVCPNYFHRLPKAS